MPHRLRPSVLAFALDVEAALGRNEHKTCWSTVPLDDLDALLALETAELSNELPDAERVGSRYPRIASEAADVGAVAMMIHDRAQGPAASANRGRK